MYKEHRIGAILLMGGSGLRFCSQTPKQFCLLAGKPLYRYALETILETGLFDEILLVCHPNWLKTLETEEIGPVRLVEGGASRQESSWAGLSGFAKPPELVLIHDAVRPFLTEAIILDNLDAALEAGAADTCIPSADTLVHAPGGEWIGSIPRRDELFRGQTPQTFRYDLIFRAHAQAKKRDSTDDCRLVLDLGEKVKIVKGSEENLKITSEFDLRVAELLLKRVPVDR
jgi:2-C-methyl-D-erythritol 4-phosphate cytidylyltransferase